MDNKLDFKIIGSVIFALNPALSERFVLGMQPEESFTRRASSATSSLRRVRSMGDRRIASAGYVWCGSRAVLREAGEEMLKSILRKGLPGINLFSM
jgi:hypothetical protein